VTLSSSTHYGTRAMALLFPGLVAAGLVPGGPHPPRVQGGSVPKQGVTTGGDALHCPQIKAPRASPQTRYKHRQGDK